MSQSYYRAKYSGLLAPDWVHKAASWEALIAGHPVADASKGGEGGGHWAFGDEGNAPAAYAYLAAGVPSDRLRKALADASASALVRDVRGQLAALPSARRQWVRGEDGCEVDIDRWSMGEVAHWRRSVRPTRLQPVVTIGVEFCKSAGQSADSWVPLAAQVVAICQELLKLRRRVRVIGIASTGCHTCLPVVTWPILAEGTRPDPDRLLCWLGHPSVLRNIGFYYWERLHLAATGTRIQTGYGSPDALSAEGARLNFGCQVYVGGNRLTVQVADVIAAATAA